MLLEPLPTPDVIAHLIPDPFRAGDELRIFAVYSDRDIENAGGKIVLEHGPGLVRIGTQHDFMEGFRMTGVILDGYGDIPAGKPFWITVSGPTLAQTGERPNAR